MGRAIGVEHPQRQVGEDVHGPVQGAAGRLRHVGGPPRCADRARGGRWRTISTGTAASFSSRSTVEPSRRRPSPLSRATAVTIRSASRVLAVSSTTSTGAPSRHHHRDGAEWSRTPPAAGAPWRGTANPAPAARTAGPRPPPRGRCPGHEPRRGPPSTARPAPRQRSKARSQRALRSVAKEEGAGHAVGRIGNRRGVGNGHGFSIQSGGGSAPFSARRADTLFLRPALPRPRVARTGPRRRR